MALVAIPLKGKDHTILITTNTAGQVLFILDPDMDALSEGGEAKAEEVVAAPWEAVDLVVKEAQIREALAMREAVIAQQQRGGLIVPEHGTVQVDPSKLRADG